jgi:uncharacterized protein (TIGR00369 family)
MDKLERIQKYTGSLPYFQLLGIQVEELHDDGATLSCRLKHELKNSHGGLHGGVLATLADVAIGVALTARFGPNTVTTVDISINYLRPVASGSVRARSHLTRVGSSLVTGRIDMTDDKGRLVAIGTATYMIIKPTRKSDHLSG